MFPHRSSNDCSGSASVCWTYVCRPKHLSWSRKGLSLVKRVGLCLHSVNCARLNADWSFSCCYLWSCGRLGHSRPSTTPPVTTSHFHWPYSLPALNSHSVTSAASKMGDHCSSQIWNFDWPSSHFLYHRSSKENCHLPPRFRHVDLSYELHQHRLGLHWRGASGIRKNDQ